ncbi:3-oxoacyl-[acyl-carrier-protein] synthase III C-terminal domain-containing protein [Brevundimonas lenta]|uniref:Alkylresorcinol/alkylpyrone synthase n=1 Tax=Brevundimonas lenta TaxID=424796 RepID=A0A7W6NP75_9CAUL|nr:alkylresorcinol/alkylpyrone synthase [Brevundimonas lenta]
MPQIVAVATAVPGYRLTQPEVRALAEAHFGPGHRRYLSVFDNALVDERHFAVPPDWFARGAGPGEANDVYLEAAKSLAAEVARDCLAKAGVEPSMIDGVIYVSSSGIAAPSIDTYVAETLGLPRTVTRVPLFGLGCAGGAAGLALAARLTEGRPASRWLLIALELNSITFQRTDVSLQNLVSTAIFADGAAAVLVAGDEAGLDGPLALLRSTTLRSPGTAGVMGWDFDDGGFRVRVSGTVPDVVRDLVPEVMEAFADLAGPDDLASLLLHPGGAKILARVEELIPDARPRLAASYATLAGFGNMSSATVLFVLDQAIRDAHPSPGALSLLAAFGPGFTAEASLLRWRDRRVPEGRPSET